MAKATEVKVNGANVVFKKDTIGSIKIAMKKAPGFVRFSDGPEMVANLLADVFDNCKISFLYRSF